MTFGIKQRDDSFVVSVRDLDRHEPFEIPGLEEHGLFEIRFKGYSRWPYNEVKTGDVAVALTLIPVRMAFATPIRGISGLPRSIDTSLFRF
jgi:hypothetical protein